jgi:hypothetical protein
MQARLGLRRCAHGSAPLAPQGNPFYILAYEMPAVDPAGRMKICRICALQGR